MNIFFKRLFTLLPVAFGVLTLTFFLLHFIPGDPVDIMLGDYASPSDRHALRSELGLDQPLLQQYLHYLKKTFSGDLGRSLQSQKPVFSEIKNRLPATLQLGLFALLIATSVGLPLGVFAAIKKNSHFDRSVLFAGLIAFSLPAMWSGPLLIWIFSMQLDLLPVGDQDGFLSLILPAVTLSIGISALLLRMTRTSMLDVLKEDYIVVAQAKGLSFFKIYFSHALSNAVVPILTLLGLMLGALLTGTVIVETIFDWPGLGLLLFQSIQNRDYPMVQGCVLFISFIYLLTNFCTDLAYAYFQPKIRWDS